MTTKYWIALGVFLAFVGVGVWDLVLATDGLRGNTLSELLYGFSREHPIVPFALGILCGHLLWPTEAIDFHER